MEQPLVSVVIPVYNVEPWLDRCVSSVARQTYPKLDIILVDDGSPDGCPGICDSWAKRDSRVRVCHKENQGLGMARNTGLDLARGDYIFFFDSDDYVAADTAEVCVASALAHGADAVLFGLCDTFPDGRTVPKTVTAGIFTGDAVTEQLLPGLFVYSHGIGISACGKMFRLETLRNAGLRFRSERQVVSEDACFALEFFPKAETAVILPRCLYYYCRREDSLTRTLRADRQQRNDLFLDTALALAAAQGLPRKVADHIMARYQFYCLGAMKQTLQAPLPPEERRKALLAIFRSPVLRRTLRPEVLALHRPALAFFYTCLKLRCFGLCRMLLQARLN